MDVKLGQRSYDPFASQEKREQQIRKYPLMEEIGFLVLGMRVSLTCCAALDEFELGVWFKQYYNNSIGVVVFTSFIIKCTPGDTVDSGNFLKTILSILSCVYIYVCPWTCFISMMAS